MRFKRVYVEITNVCNLSCSFCSNNNRRPVFMSSSDFATIAPQVKKVSDYIYLHVKGEPLIHPELSAILDICTSNNLMVNITTNGTLIKSVEEILLTTKSIRQINISLHSIMNNPIDFETHINNILSSIQLLNQQTNIIISLRLWNLPSGHENNIIFFKNKDMFQKLSDFFNIDLQILMQKYRNRGLKISDRIYINQEHEFIWPSLNNPFVSNTGFCYGLIHQIAILSNGIVTPCCLDGEGHIALGNIYDAKLSTIILDRHSHGIRNGFQTGNIVEPLCQHCSYRIRFNKY